MNKEEFIKKIKEIIATVPNEYFFLEYNKCVCDILEENQKYKDVFDKVEEYIKKKINSCTAEANSTTNDIMCRITIIGLKHLLDILNEVE